MSTSMLLQTSTDAQASCHFLSAPGEVRNQIYRLIFVREQPIRVFDAYRGCGEVFSEDRATIDPGISDPFNSEPCKLAQEAFFQERAIIEKGDSEPAIAQTCKRIREEVLSLYYGSNTFHVIHVSAAWLDSTMFPDHSPTYNPAAHAITKWLEFLGPYKVRLLRRLTASIERRGISNDDYIRPSDDNRITTIWARVTINGKGKDPLNYNITALPPFQSFKRNPLYSHGFHDPDDLPSDSMSTLQPFDSADKLLAKSKGICCCEMQSFLDSSVRSPDGRIIERAWPTTHFVGALIWMTWLIRVYKKNRCEVCGRKAYLRCNPD